LSRRERRSRPLAAVALGAPGEAPRRVRQEKARRVQRHLRGTLGGAAGEVHGLGQGGIAQGGARVPAREPPERRVVPGTSRSPSARRSGPERRRRSSRPR
jgi:hypothetical protein